MAKVPRKFPDTLLILMGILVLFIILTWILPAGEFDRTQFNGREIVVANSYKTVESQPQGLGALFMGPIKGFIGAAQIIAFVILIGGAFAMMTRTGAIDAGLFRIIQSSQQNPRRKKWVIPILMTLFSLAGATFGMSEETLVFVLITIPLALALGYDSIVGIAIPFVGAGAGFAGAFLNPFTIGVAQGIAELTPFSGVEYRLVVWAVMTSLATLFVMRYASRIEKNPEKSLVHAIDQERDNSQLAEGKIGSLDLRGTLVLLILLVSLVLLVLGVSLWDWYINEISGLFLAMGIGAAITGGLKMDEAISAFKEGAREMLVVAMVIALAKGLIVVAEDGKIIDTMLNALASSVADLPKSVSVEIMFLLQSALNFFVPSGSGQAALTMPIMAPLSDLLGISRQVAVLAFQLGDGLSNLIIPTSGITMGIISIAKVPYNVWFRWMWPLFLIMTIGAMVMLALPVLFFTW
jgi:uncharacterized ion transporter superfamily protein YfcC